MKKRTNVVVDEELLERARRVIGEKTYSGTIEKALERVVKRQQLDDAVARIRAGGDPFNAAYVRENWPDLPPAPKNRARRSADEHRMPARKRSRGSR